MKNSKLFIYMVITVFFVWLCFTTDGALPIAILIILVSSYLMIAVWDTILPVHTVIPLRYNIIHLFIKWLDSFPPLIKKKIKNE